MENTKKVLIIDDETSLLSVLSALMTRRGYEVITAENGKEGLILAQKEHPDIILSDIMMPPPNGFELRSLLNKDAQTASIPFLFLTAMAEQEDKVQGLGSGADDYITKPFDMEELFARVEAILRRTKIERENGRNQMKALAKEKIEKFKHEILKNFHHELRTPLVNVILPLEAAVSQKFSRPEDQIRFTEVAMSNATRLQALIDDFITLINIDNGQLNTHRQEINLEYDFREPIDRCLGRYQDKKLSVHVTIEENGPIYAPRSEFKQVVRHLVDNALKFSNAKGKVFVNLHAKGDGGCSITVKDSGVGIPENMRRKVFERYYQINQGGTRSYEGMGIGLTICKAIAQSLGGNIEFLNSSNGCEVLYTVPAGNSDFPVQSEI